MECIAVPWSVADRAGTTRKLHHAETPLSRGLELGEVVLLCHEAVFATATVQQIDFELADTIYTLALGASVSETRAAQMMVDDAARGGVGVTPADVLELLAELARRHHEERDNPAAM